MSAPLSPNSRKMSMCGLALDLPISSGPPAHWPFLQDAYRLGVDEALRVAILQAYDPSMLPMWHREPNPRTSPGGSRQVWSL